MNLTLITLISPKTFSFKHIFFRNSTSIYIQKVKLYTDVNVLSCPDKNLLRNVGKNPQNVFSFLKKSQTESPQFSSKTDLTFPGKFLNIFLWKNGNSSFCDYCSHPFSTYAKFTFLTLIRRVYVCVSGG